MDRDMGLLQTAPAVGIRSVIFVNVSRRRDQLLYVVDVKSHT